MNNRTGGGGFQGNRNSGASSYQQKNQQQNRSQRNQVLRQVICNLLVTRTFTQIFPFYQMLDEQCFAKALVRCPMFVTVVKDASCHALVGCVVVDAVEQAAHAEVALFEGVLRDNKGLSKIS